MLNLGDSKKVSVHAVSARQIVRDPRFNGDVQVGPMGWDGVGWG